MTAVISEPIVSAPIATSSSRRLPNMSPSRPMIGTETAATSRVEVSSQLTLPGEVSRLGREDRQHRDQHGLRERDDEGAEADDEQLEGRAAGRGVGGDLGVVVGARKLGLRQVGHGFLEDGTQGDGHSSRMWHRVPLRHSMSETGTLGDMTAGPTLRDHARGAVRDEVMRQAWPLFAEQGFEATTVDQIADAAGMSRRTFFRYFAGKDELVLERLVESGERIADALRGRPADEPVWPALRRGLRRRGGRAGGARRPGPRPAR